MGHQTKNWILFGVILGYLGIVNTKLLAQQPTIPDPYFQADQLKPLVPLEQKGGAQRGSIIRQSYNEEVENREAFELGKVLALVEGEPVFVADLMFEVNQLIEQHMGNAPSSIKEKQRSLLIPKLLPKYVESKILFHGILKTLPSEANIENVIEEAGKEFDENALPEMMESAGIASPTEFDAQLRAQGTSLRQRRRAWSIEQLTKMFLGREISKVDEVTHAELLQVYKKNLKDYEFPAKAIWEQIVVRFDKSSSRDAAKAKIVELGSKLVHGANFSALAKKSSDGFRRAEGGRHDWTTQGALVAKKVDQAIFSLPVGELSGIIESDQGYHIVRVVERQEAGCTPFLEAQISIKESLMVKRRKKAFEDYLAKLKKEIRVEYLEH